MVTRDRGQLILVGAVAIALVLLGLVLVVNTALFTQVVGSEGTVETAKDGAISGQEVGEAIASSARSLNDDYGQTASSKNNTLDTNTIPNLEPILQNRSMESGGAFVSVNYDSINESGTFVSQNQSSGFTSVAGNPTWQPIPLGQEGDIGGFLMTIDYAASGTGDPFTVYVDSVGGPNRSLTITPESGSEVAISTSTGTTCSDVPVTSNTVRIDVTHGVVFEDHSCQFDLFAGTNPGYVMTFTGGDEVAGTYQFVTDSDLTSYPAYGAAGSQPTPTEAVWSFEYSFTYDTPGATVESESRVIDVYD
ncbi:hypothetical protein L593_13600 [Salinarchaeum sp. Harcht-Bsk1]|uniref:DUF7261 family protein n=1 Tax=Salinarchaeum sp. Harcht-Bsk1 TaxID=1333523 RepID=UPI0003422961|nr:hypothetical protein [Salinarchaeum sp. Harcht-Bsk1]AGN02659.1 hypothetical protein L593_13600 [Salinarchaeum sp. Harcht-Bsk1]